MHRTGKKKKKTKKKRTRNSFNFSLSLITPSFSPVFPSSFSFSVFGDLFLKDFREGELSEVSVMARGAESENAVIFPSQQLVP